MSKKVVNVTEVELGRQHSEEIQEIISVPPSWMLNWGIVFLLAVMILVLGLSALIKYPDIVKTRLKIKSSQLSEPVLADTSGVLLMILIQENEVVSKGQPLAYVGSSILKAPQAGQVIFDAYTGKGKYVKVNQPVFYINVNDTNYFGEMMILPEHISKVKEGQEVLIKLQLYPYEEYGPVHGKIASINATSYSDSFFVSKVVLTGNKDIQIDKRIQLRSGLSAQAEIITEETTLYNRLMSNIRKIFLR